MRDFTSHRLRALPQSGIRRFFDIAATLRDVISLGIGEPDFVTPSPFLEAGIASLRRGETHYTSNSGTIELRRAVSAHLEQRYHVSYDPEVELLITVGTSEALYLSLNAILDPGDEVLVPEPCFVAYMPEITLAGGTPVPVTTRLEDGFQVTREALAAAITPRTKAILISYPNNPTGAVMSREKLSDIALLAEERDLLVISDEVYDRLVYAPMSGGSGQASHTCFPSLPNMLGRTILLGGFSKSHAMTGFRVGYAAAPRELSAAMRKIHQYTIMSAPSVAQAAALEATLRGDEHVERMRLEYDRRRRLIVSGFNRMGLDTFEPQGAFYAFPSVRKTGLSSSAFAERLLAEERVAVVPGDAFGASGQGFVRASYATSYEKIEEALARIERFLGRL